MSNINAIAAGLKTTLEAAPGIQTVYDHRAAAIGETPAIVFWVGPWKLLAAAYGEMAIEWTIPGRIIVPYGNFDSAEAAIREVLPGIIAAVAHALDLQGALPDGQALVTGGQSGKIMVAGTPFHAMEITIIAAEQFPFAYA